MLLCFYHSVDCHSNVRELLLRLYANRESCEAGVSAVRVSSISFILISKSIVTSIFSQELMSLRFRFAFLAAPSATPHAEKHCVLSPKPACR